MSVFVSSTVFAKPFAFKSWLIQSISDACFNESIAGTSLGSVSPSWISALRS